MKRTWKIAGALLLALTLIFSLAACGNTDSDAKSSGNAAVKSNTKTLIVYFSNSGNTERVAKTVAAATGADLFEIEAEEAYTEEDLNWMDANSRVNREHDNESLRNIALKQSTAPNWKDYDTIYIGYPIWWGIAAWPVSSFVSANDFSGKTVYTFCTSSSSDLGDSASLLQAAAGEKGDWKESVRFQSSVSDSEIRTWVDSLQ